MQHTTQTNQKNGEPKKTITDFLLLLFFPRFRVLLIHFERKIAFSFQTLFRFQLVINQAANVTTSQRTNRTPEIRLEHIPSWSQAKKIYIRKEKQRRTNCMLDVNNPKQHCRKVGFQFQGGRGTSPGGGGGGQTASHTCKLATSQRKTCRDASAGPTDRRVAYTKAQTRRPKCDSTHKSAQQLGQKTKDDTSACACRHGCYERGCCNLPLKAHQQWSANHGGSKKRYKQRYQPTLKARLSPIDVK